MQSPNKDRQKANSTSHSTLQQKSCIEQKVQPPAEPKVDPEEKFEGLKSQGNKHVQKVREKWVLENRKNIKKFI